MKFLRRRGGDLPRLAVLLTLFTSNQLSGQVTFIDVASGHDIAHESYGRGSAMVDLDGDFLLDIITGNDRNPNEFFRQLPDHTFEQVNDAWGIPFEESSTWATLVADFDNDGDPDVYFVNGTATPNQLLRNDLNSTGVFTDVSDFSGDGNLVNRNFGGTTLDYNRDGLLDIFLTNPNNGRCFLLRNEGGLVFTNVSNAAGIVHAGSFRHCSAGDFNNDGWWDIAVGDYGNIGTSNVLYRNNQDGTFTNVAASAGVESPLRNFGMVLEDFDNDGWMDIFVPKYHYLPTDTNTSELYRNNGDGTFTNVTQGSGLGTQTDMGHNTGDVDGDGYPDIFIGTGHPGFLSNDLLLLITPNGEGGFTATDVSDSSGITAQGPTRCHGIALGDYDQDGSIDIYTNNGGPPSQEGFLEENFLWHNLGTGNRWTALRLTGVISNRSAIGARCVATTNTGREVHRVLRAGNGFGNTSSPVLHFGIGTETGVQSIEITWPSGIVQLIDNPPLAQIINVTEAGCVGAAQCNDGEICTADTCDEGTCVHKGIVYGDVNESGNVDLDDLLCVIAGFSDVAACPTADIAGCEANGVIDMDDILAIIGAFGGVDPCCSGE